jgi:hypothetical protein
MVTSNNTKSRINKDHIMTNRITRATTIKTRNTKVSLKLM